VPSSDRDMYVYIICDANARPFQYYNNNARPDPAAPHHHPARFLSSVIQPSIHRSSRNTIDGMVHGITYRYRYGMTDDRAWHGIAAVGDRYRLHFHFSLRIIALAAPVFFSFLAFSKSQKRPAFFYRVIANTVLQLVLAYIYIYITN
jgi:hypothetical protein